MSKPDYTKLSRLMALGVEIAASILISLFIGIKLDSYLKTSPIFIIIFLLIGLGAMIKIIIINLKD